jgi:uncharacterized RDD family membrane protein YckC
MSTPDDELPTWVGPPPEVAPLSARLAAKLIDLLLEAPLKLFASTIAAVVMGLSMTSLLKPGQPFTWTGVTLALRGGFLLVLAASALPLGLTVYQWVLLATRGQTLGKRLCSIRIVDTAARPTGFLRALLLREWLFFLVLVLVTVPLSLFFSPYLIFLVLLLDPAMVFTDGRRTLHDYFAGTQVRWVKDYELGRLKLAWGLIPAGIVVYCAVFFLSFQAQEELTRRVLELRPMFALEQLPSMPTLGSAPTTPAVKSKPGAFYRYTDRDGVVYVVDSLAKVPERYRGRAEEMK